MSVPERKSIASLISIEIISGNVGRKTANMPERQNRKHAPSVIYIFNMLFWSDDRNDF